MFSYLILVAICTFYTGKSVLADHRSGHNTGRLRAILGVPLEWSEDCLKTSTSSLSRSCSCPIPINSDNILCSDSKRKTWATGSMRCARGVRPGSVRHMVCSKGRWRTKIIRSSRWRCINVPHYGRGEVECPAMGSAIFIIKEEFKRDPSHKMPDMVLGVPLQWTDNCVAQATKALLPNCACPAVKRLKAMTCLDSKKKIWAAGARRCGKSSRTGIYYHLKCIEGRWRSQGAVSRNRKCINKPRYGLGTSECSYVGSTTTHSRKALQPVPIKHKVPSPVPIKQVVANTPSTKQILFAVTSLKTVDGVFGPRNTGYFVPEVANAYYPFIRAGFKVVFASPKGGVSQKEDFSQDFCLQMKIFSFNNDCDRFKTDNDAQALLRNTLTAQQAASQSFDAIFFPGGTGSMIDVANNPSFAALAAKIYEQGGIVSSVCHGSGSLAQIILSNGDALVQGRTVTGLSNLEESFRGNQRVELPWTVEDKLTELGANYIAKGIYSPHTEQDGRLITGQNYASTFKMAKLVIDAMS